MTRALAAIERLNKVVPFLPDSARERIRQKVKFAGYETIRLTSKQENSHQLGLGDSGSGKSQLAFQRLLYCNNAGTACAVHDPEREYIKKFYNQKRGDIIIDPTDERCPYWNISNEGYDFASFRSVAQSAFPSLGKDPTSTIFNMWTVSVMTFLLDHYRPTTEQLGYWLASIKEIDALVRGTSYQHMLPKNAAPQRAGVLGLLATFSDALCMMPSAKEGKPEFFISQWVKNPRGRWIFFCSDANTRKAVQPIHSMMMDLILVGLMSPDATNDKINLEYDELQHCNTLPKLPDGLTNIRKRGHNINASFQNVESMINLYPAHYKTMLSQPYTKFIFATSEGESAKYLSAITGTREIVRLEEGINSRGITESHSHTRHFRYEEKPAYSAGAIAGMDNLHAIFLQRGFKDNLVAVPIEIPYISDQIPDIALTWIKRTIPPRDIFDLRPDEDSDEDKKANEQKGQFTFILQQLVQAFTQTIKKNAEAEANGSPPPEIDITAVNPERALAEYKAKNQDSGKQKPAKRGAYIPA